MTGLMLLAVLCQPGPTAAYLDGLDGASTHTELAANSGISSHRCVNGEHRRFSQLRIAASLTSLESAIGNRIVNVLLLRAPVQTCGVHATEMPVGTKMQRIQLPAGPSVGVKAKHVAVRHPNLATNPKASSTVWESGVWPTNTTEPRISNKVFQKRQWPPKLQPTKRITMSLQAKVVRVAQDILFDVNRVFTRVDRTQNLFSHDASLKADWLEDLAGYNTARFSTLYQGLESLSLPRSSTTRCSCAKGVTFV